MQIFKPILVAFLLAANAFAADWSTDIMQLDVADQKPVNIQFKDTSKLNKKQCYNYFEELMNAGVAYEEIQALSLNCTALLDYSEPMTEFDMPQQDYQNFETSEHNLYEIYAAPQYNNETRQEQKGIKRKDCSGENQQLPTKRPKTENKKASVKKKKNLNKTIYPAQEPRIGREFQVDLSLLGSIDEEMTEMAGTLVFSPNNIGHVNFQSLAHEDAKLGIGLMNSEAAIVEKYISQYIENNEMNETNETNKTSAETHAQLLFDMALHFEETNKISAADFYCEMSAELGNKEAQKNFELIQKAGKNRKKLIKATPKKPDVSPKRKKIEGDGQEDIEWGIAYFYGIEGAKLDKERAKTCFQEAKRFGHKEACFWLGKYYEEKFHATSNVNNHQQAIENYIIAAKKGSAAAQYTLGLYFYTEYQKDTSDKDNLEKAVIYYQRAAKNGHAIAQNNLGTLYETGEGVEESAEMAEGWYRCSALQGCDLGQYNLGLCYEEGFFVEQNNAEATKFFKLAADQGNIEAAEILKNRDSNQ